MNEKVSNALAMAIHIQHCGYVAANRYGCSCVQPLSDKTIDHYSIVVLDPRQRSRILRRKRVIGKISSFSKNGPWTMHVASIDCVAVVERLCESINKETHISIEVKTACGTTAIKKWQRLNPWVDMEA